ncbi:hypothetical protein [Leptospira noguchii]|uniref:hypothetical protein n=1 Tax=Leptospira noguchii TaxID=28182 RepID=UPI0009E5A2A9|nr:hypothetical protein [Leptospira noguchii]
MERKRTTQAVSLLWSLGKLKTLLPAVATLGCEPVHYEICELRRRPGNSVNAYLWVGVQGVVAPEFIIRPNFLTSNSR